MDNSLDAGIRESNDQLEFDPSHNHKNTSAAIAAAAVAIGSNHRGPQSYIDDQPPEGQAATIDPALDRTKDRASAHTNPPNGPSTHSGSAHDSNSHAHDPNASHPNSTPQHSQYGDVSFGLDMLASTDYVPRHSSAGQDGSDMYNAGPQAHSTPGPPQGPPPRQQPVPSHPVQQSPSVHHQPQHQQQQQQHQQQHQHQQLQQPPQQHQHQHQQAQTPQQQHLHHHPGHLGHPGMHQQVPAPSGQPQSIMIEQEPPSRKRKSGQISQPLGQPMPLEEADNGMAAQARASANMDITELALRVRKEENGPSAEKSRQLFGMTWLYKNCTTSPDDNVPRNRIYARYVALCSELNLKPLNPASFGKLVRSVFQGIKTRRLGVRGQSKYHYCGLKLIGDQNNPTGSTPVGTPGRYGNSPDSVGANSSFRMDGGTSGYVNSPYSTPQGARSSSAVDLEPKNGGTLSFQTQQLQTLQGLGTLFKDPSDISLSSQSHESFTILPLEDFYDTSADPDSATTLYGLYRAHCRSLIEALRFMHVKKFLNFETSFIGTLTAPVQKLLKEDGVIAWTAKVDWLTYREMVQLLSPLVLQDVPPQVLQGLRSLCNHLPATLSEAVKNQTEAYQEARMKPALAFVALVDRLLRTNEAGQNAGRILILEPELRQMRSDWTQFINAPTLVEREVPCGGGELVARILQEEVIRLLSPDEYGDVFDPEVMEFRHTKDENGRSHASKLEEVIVKWARYLSSLPSRFPHVPPRLFLLTFTSVVNAALREITFNGAVSFGAWWVVQCWIGEWMHWTAELGGFLTASGPDQGDDGDIPDQDSEELKKYLHGQGGRLRLAFPSHPLKRESPLMPEYISEDQ